MIRAPRPVPTPTTTRAVLDTVAAAEGRTPVQAGGWLYVARTPLLGQPVVVRCAVEVR